MTCRCPMCGFKDAGTNKSNKLYHLLRIGKFDDDRSNKALKSECRGMLRARIKQATRQEYQQAIDDSLAELEELQRMLEADLEWYVLHPDEDFSF